MRDQLSRISFAQAEYYHSGRTIKHLALWQMNWRARLRRFKWPGGSIMNECATAGGPVAACAALPAVMGRMSWATVH
jgi:hypothetical protein